MKPVTLIVIGVVAGVLVYWLTRRRGANCCPTQSGAMEGDASTATPAAASAFAGGEFDPPGVC